MATQTEFEQYLSDHPEVVSQVISENGATYTKYFLNDDSDPEAIHVNMNGQNYYQIRR